MAFIGALCLILVLTTLAGHFCNRMGIPAVIGQILVGIVIGPAMLGLIDNTDLVQTFANIGVIMLMFIGGLESNLTLLRRFLKPAIIVAMCGVVMPVVLMGATAALAFHYGTFEAIYIGVIFSATSVSISVAVLRDYHALDTSEGAAITGFNRQSSFVIGAGMISRGEMGMITAQIGYQAGVLSRASYSEFVVVIILATMVAPFALKQALKLLPKNSHQRERTLSVDAGKQTDLND